MLSHDTTPRFRNLSIHSTPRFISTSSFSVHDKDHEERRDPEKECFMCRQANVYMKPIGMLQERRVERRHPPPLTRAKIDELSQKKKLTKREARLLLQCYFPEIKNVKYFQLHKYHSCCYDPKHLNLCKNHITALQHEREKYPDQHFYPHDHDHDHYMSNDGQQHRVSFVRIKIEPTKGIPTRFLGPTALPESLADMLIKQVNRYENKKRPLSFNSESQNTAQTHKVRRLDQVPYVTDVSRLSEHLANLDSDDDDDDEDDDGDDTSDDDENKQDEYNLNTPNSNIRGFQGKVMDRSRLKYERKLQSRQEKDKDKEDMSTNVTNGDLVVEDIDEINHLFTNEQGSTPSKPTKPSKPFKPLKKKKRKKRNKKPSQTHHHHHHPKLNHWEQMALDQSKQEVCGCRHHVKRLEADQIIYDWCRCKDHLHKDVKQRRKSIPPPPPPPPPPLPSPPSPPKKVKKVTPASPKIEKKTVGINATEKTTTELALAYDPTTVDYDVIQEILYYRTSSGRLVKPEITNAFSYNDKSSAKGLNHNKSYSKKPGILPILEVDEKYQSKATPTVSKRGSTANGYTLVDTDALSIKNGIGGLIPSFEVRNSFSTATGAGGMYGNDDDNNNDDHDDDNDDDDDQDDQDDDDQDETVDFTPPKYLPDMPVVSPAQSPSLPMSLQKSSKPTYANQRPTPNFERESSLLANRRWFDQALGDQNLLAVHDGRYGLIAGTSAEEYKVQSQFPDNEYVEPLPRKNKSNCTIS